MTELRGIFETLSPLSHIGESISTNSYLVEEPIVQADGTVIPVFCLSGNSWRGQIRDGMAAYLLDILGTPLPREAVAFCFCGGTIAGNQVVDIERIKHFYAVLPPLAVLGGGVGNMLLAGKAKIGNIYPVCAETMRLVPEQYRVVAPELSYSQLTMEKSFTRRDDLKDVEKTGKLLAGNDAGASDAKDVKSDNLDQMRYTCELLVAGTTLYTEILLPGSTNLELGALVSGLVQWAKKPFVGGQSGRGHGRVNLRYDIDGGDEFLSVCHGKLSLCKLAKQVLDEYRDYVVQNKEEIVQAILEAA